MAREGISAAEFARTLHENESLQVALRHLLAAFRRHRTATHEITRTKCRTCLESDAAIAQAQEALGA